MWHPLTQLIFHFFKLHEKLIWSLLSQQISASCTGKITCNIGDATWVAKPVNHRVNMMSSNTWWKHPFSFLLEIHDLIQAFFNLFRFGISSRSVIKKRIASALFFAQYCSPCWIIVCNLCNESCRVKWVIWYYAHVGFFPTLRAHSKCKIT